MTRGYKPWRPDAVIGTAKGANKTFPRNFMDNKQHTTHPKIQDAIPIN